MAGSTRLMAEVVWWGICSITWLPAPEGPGPTIPEKWPEPHWSQEKELWGGAWGTRPCSASPGCHWEGAAAPQHSARPQPHPALVLQTVSQSLPPGGDWRAAITV